MPPKGSTKSKNEELKMNGAKVEVKSKSTESIIDTQNKQSQRRNSKPTAINNTTTEFNNNNEINPSKTRSSVYVKRQRK